MSIFIDFLGIFLRKVSKSKNCDSAKKTLLVCLQKDTFFSSFLSHVSFGVVKKGFFVVSTFLVPTKTTFCKLFGHFNLNALILKWGNWRNLVKELSPQIANLNEDSFYFRIFFLIF